MRNCQKRRKRSSGPSIGDIQEVRDISIGIRLCQAVADDTPQSKFYENRGKKLFVKDFFNNLQTNKLQIINLSNCLLKKIIGKIYDSISVFFHVISSPNNLFS